MLKSLSYYKGVCFLRIDPGYIVGTACNVAGVVLGFFCLSHVWDKQNNSSYIPFRLTKNPLPLHRNWRTCARTHASTYTTCIRKLHPTYHSLPIVQANREAYAPSACGYTHAV